MDVFIDERIRKMFPGLDVETDEIDGVKVAPSSQEQLIEIEKVEAEMRRKYVAEELKDLRIVRLYRDFFWRVGIDPTKTRPAAEALLRRVVRGGKIPRICNVVDAYNLASMQTMITLSAFDRDRINPPLRIRFAQGEEITLIGKRRMKLENDIVLCDSSRILCSYAHGDVEETKVTPDTKNLLLVAYGAPGISREELRNAMSLAKHYIEKFCI